MAEEYLLARSALKVMATALGRLFHGERTYSVVIFWCSSWSLNSPAQHFCLSSLRAETRELCEIGKERSLYIVASSGWDASALCWSRVG